MGTHHIIGIDLQFRLGQKLRILVQKKRLANLIAIGFLRAFLHQNLALKRAQGPVAQDFFEHLTAFTIHRVVDNEDRIVVMKGTIAKRGTRDMGNRMTQSLQSLKDEFPDVIEDIRGKGLLVGMKLKKKNVDVRLKLLEHGLLVGTAGDNVLRMAPPLIIDETHIREAVEKLRAVFTEAKSWDSV